MVVADVSAFLNLEEITIFETVATLKLLPLHLV